MGLNLTALGLKWLSAWLVLSLFTLATGMPFIRAAQIAVVVAVGSWIADLIIPFRVQGWTRWAIDSLLAAFTVYLAPFLWPGPALSAPSTLLAGVVIGAIEIPLHFFLAARFHLDDRTENRNRLR